MNVITLKSFQCFFVFFTSDFFYPSVYISYCCQQSIILFTLKYLPFFLQDIRIVYQFHYKNWPDHDVPSSVEHILGMIDDIRALQKDDSPPICVHCRFVYFG